MPISRDLFDRQIDPTDRRILDFLETHSSEAYTMYELAEAVNFDLSRITGEFSFYSRLNDLKTQGFIESKTIHSNLYFSVVA